MLDLSLTLVALSIMTFNESWNSLANLSRYCEWERLLDGFMPSLCHSVVNSWMSVYFNCKQNHKEEFWSDVVGNCCTSRQMMDSTFLWSSSDSFLLFSLQLHVLSWNSHGLLNRDASDSFLRSLRKIYCDGKGVTAPNERWKSVFNKIYFLRADEIWNAGYPFSIKDFFFSGQIKHGAPEKFGEKLKKPEFRQ